MNDAARIRISVQICTHNRKDLLRRSLDALFRVDFPESWYEIVLVDDGGTDGTEEMVKALDPPCALKYLYQQKAGLSAGRNLGIRNCAGEVVLFIDDDIIADPGLLREHWLSHQQYPRSVILGRVNHMDNLDGDLRLRYKPADFSSSFFWTSNVSVRKRFLEEAGLFDEEFTEYGWEDVELGYRLRGLGLSRKCNPRAAVHHYKCRWKASDLPRLYRQAESSGRSAVILVRKHPCARARLSTGVFGLRLAWDRVLRLGEGLYAKMVDRAGDGRLVGLKLLSARMLVGLRYFDSVRAALVLGETHPTPARERKSI